MMKIFTTPESVSILVTNQHDRKSHANDFSIGLTNTQKDLLKGAVQNDPLASCNALRRGLERSSPEHRISHSKLKLARNLATAVRKEVMLPILNGIPLKGTFRDLADLAVAKDLAAAIRRHKADPLKHHLEPAVKAYMQSAQFSKDPATRGLPLDYVNADNNPSVGATMEDIDVLVNICTAHSGAIQKKTEADLNKFVDSGPLETK